MGSLGLAALAVLGLNVYALILITLLDVPLFAAVVPSAPGRRSHGAAGEPGKGRATQVTGTDHSRQRERITPAGG